MGERNGGRGGQARPIRPLGEDPGRHPEPWPLELLVFIERERHLLAIEVHDVISQAVASLQFRAQMCEFALDDDPDQVRPAIGQIRQTAYDLAGDVARVLEFLRPPVLDYEGVLAAIRRYVQNFTRQTGIEVCAEIPEGPTGLGELGDLFLYRIVQEALSNILKHAGAREITLRLGLEEGRLSGQIRDDGRGFDVEAPPPSGSGRARLGLVGMRERARLLGGHLAIESRPGDGTAIVFSLPQDGAHAPAPRPAPSLRDARGRRAPRHPKG